MGLEIAARVRCYPEDKYGYSQKYCVPITASHFSAGPPEPESSKRVKDVRTISSGLYLSKKAGKKKNVIRLRCGYLPPSDPITFTQPWSKCTRC